MIFMSRDTCGDNAFSLETAQSMEIVSSCVQYMRAGNMENVQVSRPTQFADYLRNVTWGFEEEYNVLSDADAIKER